MPTFAESNASGNEVGNAQRFGQRTVDGIALDRLVRLLRRQAGTLPPFSRMMHLIHLTGGEPNLHMACYRGDCTTATS